MMRHAKLLPVVAVVLTAACADVTGTGPDVARPRARITQTCTKEPGPTNTTGAENPAHKKPPGQQPSDPTVTNGENNCQKSKN